MFENIFRGLTIHRQIADTLERLRDHCTCSSCLSQFADVLKRLKRLERLERNHCTCSHHHDDKEH